MSHVLSRSRLVRMSAIATILTIAPLAISPSQGLTINEAAASCTDHLDGGTCCPRINDFCTTSAGNVFDYAWQDAAEGPCGI